MRHEAAATTDGLMCKVQMLTVVLEYAVDTLCPSRSEVFVIFVIHD